MKICQVVPSLEPQYGGPSRSVRALSAALARAGHDVELLATEDGPGDEQHDGRLHVRIFRRDRPQWLCPSAGLKAALRAGVADVIHHHSLWLRTLHHAHRAARVRRTPLVVSPRGMMSAWAWHHRGWRKKVSRMLVHPGALAAAAGWHATSAAEEEEIRARGFKQPVCVSPNGVEPPAADEMTAAAQHWLEACPAAAKQRVALFYSRFHQKKRVLELIDLWLEQAPADWLLLMVGIPEDYTPEALDRYVMRASGGGRVKIFSGVGRPPPYAVASLSLLPSHNENFGLAVAEALAHGVPAVVTDTTPWAALNRDERGWCVPWGDYAQALRTATAETPAQLRTRGERSRAWVLEECSWDKAALLVADFYAQLTGGVR